MGVVHLQVTGTWAWCDQPGACELQFHFPDTTPAEMAAMPYLALLNLLEVLDPPNEVAPDGMKVWQNRLGVPHRDYDLPAVIWADDTLLWYQQGEHHRDGERAAITYADGWREWWLRGLCVVILRGDGRYVIGAGSKAREIEVFPAGQLEQLHADTTAFILGDSR